MIHPISTYFGCTDVLLVVPNITKRTSNGQSHNQPSGKERMLILDKGTFYTEKAIVRKIDLNWTVIFLVWLIYFTKWELFFQWCWFNFFVAVMPTMMTLYVDYEKVEWVGRAYINHKSHGHSWGNHKTHRGIWLPHLSEQTQVASGHLPS